MKTFLRGLLFTYLALLASQQLAKTFIVFDDKSFWMILIALTLLHVFKRPLLDLVSLPSKGLLFQIISFFLTAILMNILVAIVPNFRFLETNTPSFFIFGYMLPSTYLSAFLAGIYTAAAISLISNCLNWLCSKK